jgi:hypothetical protein
MSEFSELVRGFCTVAVSGGLMLIMAPDGNLKKYVKFVLSLCMVCALLSAFFTFSEKAEWLFSEMETEAEDSAAKTESELRIGVVNQAKKNMEAELCALLSAHTGAPKSDIYVVAQIDARDLSAVEITKITVFLADMEKSEDVRAYLAEMFMGSVPIDIMKKGE